MKKISLALIRQGRGNLRQHRDGGLCQDRIAHVPDLGHAECDGFDFLATERLGWKRIVLGQAISITAFAVNSSTCCSQAIDVTIQRTERHACLLR